MIVIFRKSDLKCVGTASSVETIQQEIELNVIPNFGGKPEDYDYVETDKTNFHLELINGEVIIVENPQEPVSEPVDIEKVAMAEAIIDLEARLSELEGRLNA